MNEEDRCSARPFARGLVDELKTLGAHGIECPLRIFDTKSDVSQAATSAVLVDELLHRRVGREWLEQLDEIGTIADFEKHFANQVGSENILAMNHSESEGLVRSDLTIELTLPDCNRDVVHKLDAWNLRRSIVLSRHPLSFFALLFRCASFTPVRQESDFA
jgi:hypothetical protein